MRKIVFKSNINLSSTRADVHVGNSFLGTVRRSRDAWHAISANGKPMLAPIPCEPVKIVNGTEQRIRDARGRHIEIRLGDAIIALRDELERRLNAKHAPTV